MTPLVLDTGKELNKVYKDFNRFNFLGNTFGFDIISMPYNIVLTKDYRGRYSNSVNTELPTKEEDLDVDIAYELGKYKEFDSIEELFSHLDR